MGPASVLSFAFFLLVAATDQANLSLIHEEYISCLRSQNAYPPNNSSYPSVFYSAVQNLRILTSRPSLFIPSLIITPSHDYEVQAAIRCATKTRIQIRVCSGGHDYEGLSHTSTTPFVLIDLRNLNSISIDNEENTAWVKSGATLGELYHKIAVTGKTLAFVAGVCPTVGVGGHFSGGGYSMMSRKFGLAIDNIIDAKVMDVNGEILESRESMGDDLFWAIRGGGGTSFGIVLAWKIRLLRVTEKVTVFNVTKTLEQNATDLLHIWQHVASTVDENLLIRVFINTLDSSENGKKTVHVSFTSLFLGGVDDLLTIMKWNFPELGLERDDCVELSWIESILYFSGQSVGGFSIDSLLNRGSTKYYFKGKSDYVTRPISEHGWKEICDRLLSEGSFPMRLQLTPNGGEMSRISESATPFPHREGILFLIHYGTLWENEAESCIRVDWMKSFYDFMASYVSESPRAAYFNYRDLDLGDAVDDDADMQTKYETARVWGSKYFKKNFDRLVFIKTKADPQNFFRNEQSIPPMTSRASSL